MPGVPGGVRKLQILRWLHALTDDETFRSEQAAQTPTCANLTAFMVEAGCFQESYPEKGSLEKEEAFEAMQQDISRNLARYRTAGLVSRSSIRLPKTDDDRDIRQGYRSQLRTVYHYDISEAGEGKAERLKERFRRARQQHDHPKEELTTVLLPQLDESYVKTTSLTVPPRPAPPKKS